MKNKSISLRKVFRDTIFLYKKYLFFLLFTAFITELLIMLSMKEQNGNLFHLMYFLFLLFSYPIVTLYIDRGKGKLDIDIVYQGIRRAIPLLINAVLFFLLFLFGLIAFVVPGILVFVIFSQAFYFVILEDKGPLESFGLSKALTKGNRMKILFFNLPLLAVGAISMVLYYFYNVDINNYYPWAGVYNIITYSVVLILYYPLWKNLRAASIK